MTSVFESAFFANVQPYTGESVVGYCIRLAERNRLQSINRLLAVASQRLGRKVSSMEDLVTDKDALSALGSVTYSGGEALGARSFSRVQSASGKYLGYQGTVLPIGAFMISRGQVCPLCLAEEPFVRAEWDLAHAASCTTHGIWLVDSCDRCGAVISNRRVSVCHCKACGFDLRRSATVPASDAAVDLTEDSLALAPIRLGKPDSLYVEHPEQLFRLVQVFAADDRAFWSNKFMQGRVQNFRGLARKAGLEALAECREGFLYRADHIYAKLAERFSHLAAVLDHRGMQRRVRQSLLAAGFMGITAGILVHGIPEPLDTRAAEYYQKKPPRCLSMDEVALVLGVAIEECHALKSHGLICEPFEDFGYDADEILACKRFLDGLMLESDVDNKLGCSGVTALLADFGLLESWQPLAGQPRRYHSLEVARFLDRLRISVSAPRGPQDTLTILAYSAGRALSPLLIARMVNGAIRGILTLAGWEPPWHLGTLRFPKANLLSEADRIHAEGWSRPAKDLL